MLLDRQAIFIEIWCVWHKAYMTQKRLPKQQLYLENFDFVGLGWVQYPMNSFILTGSLPWLGSTSLFTPAIFLIKAGSTSRDNPMI